MCAAMHVKTRIFARACRMDGTAYQVLGTTDAASYSVHYIDATPA